MFTPAHRYGAVPVVNMQSSLPYNHNNLPGASNSYRPGMTNNLSQKSQASSAQTALPWPTSSIQIKPQPLATHLGQETWLSLAASVALIGAATFSLYASSTRLAFPVGALSGETVNIPNLSALITATGSIVAAAFAFAVSLIGRYWILRQIKRERTITIHQWSAIASSGSLSHLYRAGKIGGGLFLLTALSVKLVGTALSGALVPSLLTTSSMTWTNAIRLSGSFGKPYMSSMVACGPDFNCPATFFGPSIDGAISFGLTGIARSANGYFSIGESRFENLDAASSQSQIQYAVLRVPSSRLNNRFEATSVEACLPMLDPIVACAVSEDPTTVRRENDTFLSFEDMCGRHIEAGTAHSSGAFTFLCNSTTDQHLMSLILYLPASFVRYDCSITANEADAQTYFNYSSSTYRRGSSCGASIALNTTEMLPLITSVTEKLDLSPTHNGFNSHTILLSDPGAEQVKRLEDAIKAGMSIAASSLYFLARGTENRFMATSYPHEYTATFPTVPAEVHYRAYGWQRGYKTYCWDAILCISGVLALIAAALGTRPRLRYDPTDWAQTVVIGLNSKDLDPPVNSDTGVLPADCGSTRLQYGRVAPGQVAQFTTSIPCTSVV